MVIRILSIIFIITGLLLLGFSVSVHRQTKAFIKEAASTQAVITEVMRRSSISNFRFYTTYYYKLSYKTASGESIETTTSTGQSSPEYSVGDMVPILYDPEHPEQIEIDSFSWLWFNFGFLSVLGGCFLGTGLCNLWITAIPVKRIRTQATLWELKEAFRSGRLKRNSEYQGLLVAFTFVGFALLGVVIIVVFFASITTKIILGIFVLYAVIQIVRSRKRRKSTSS